MRKLTLMEWTVGGVVVVGLLIASLFKSSHHEATAGPAISEKPGSSTVPIAAQAAPPSRLAESPSTTPTPPVAAVSPPQPKPVVAEAVKPANLPAAVKEIADSPTSETKWIVVPIILPLRLTIAAAKPVADDDSTGRLDRLLSKYDAWK
jgi:hypothetical protein